MPSFQDHIKQAKHNLNFFIDINQSFVKYTDWQVTSCFYVALHLINAHLAKSGLQYRNHNDVKNAISPKNQISISKIPEDTYVSYVSLQILSRRSRYLVNEKDNNLKEETAHFTYEKHLSKSIYHLDKILEYFNSEYDLGLKDFPVKCDSLSSSTKLSVFKRS